MTAGGALAPTRCVVSPHVLFRPSAMSRVAGRRRVVSVSCVVDDRRVVPVRRRAAVLLSMMDIAIADRRSVLGRGSVAGMVLVDMHLVWVPGGRMAGLAARIRALHALAAVPLLTQQPPQLVRIGPGWVVGDV